jgi:hypothetical protein
MDCLHTTIFKTLKAHYALSYVNIRMKCLNKSRVCLLVYVQLSRQATGQILYGLSNFLFNWYIDYDECSEHNGGCTEVCINTVGSFQCQCKKRGYMISNDTNMCEGMTFTIFDFMLLTLSVLNINLVSHFFKVK